MTMPSSASQYLGQTVKSRQGYWYEVHEADRDDEELHLIPVDTVPGQYVSVEDLDERMADSWELVYDGTTGLYERGELEDPAGRSAFASENHRTNAGGQDV